MAIDEAVRSRNTASALTMSIESLQYLGEMIQEQLEDYGTFNLSGSVAVDFLSTYYIRIQDDENFNRLIAELSKYPHLNQWRELCIQQQNEAVENRRMLSQILEHLQAYPGSRQDKLMLQFCEGRIETMRSFLFEAAADGHVVREKYGRTYLLYPTDR